MNATSSPNKFRKTLALPYQLGVFLAANAVQDSCVVVDGLNCVMPKLYFLAGNHDLYSTLLSPDGSHRVVCTMSGPLPQRANPEKHLSGLLQSVADSGRFKVLLLTGLPFLKLTGMDYEGIAAGVTGVPAADVPAKSMDSDWLEGYALALDALARALPAGKVKKRKRAVALVGGLFDRNERDHAANLAELRKLLELCGLELACVFPSGGKFGELSRALEAEVVVSLPYGRKAAARIAARSGARLVETGLPLGLKGTSLWLQAVRAAAGLKGGLPPAVKELEKGTAAALAPALDLLAHRSLLFTGDPHLYAAFSAFAAELCMRVTAALLDSAPRPLEAGAPELLLFSPDTAEAAAAVKGLDEYLRPSLAVGNSFTVSEGLAPDLPFTEFGFPSYGHHCLSDEPFLGYAGALTLAGRLLNPLCSARAPEDPLE